MIVRMLVLGLLLLSLFLTEAVVVPGIDVYDVPPDLTVLAVVGLALVDGPATGTRFGFVAGLGRDLLAGPVALMGPWTLALLLVGYVAGSARPYVAGTELSAHAVVGAAAAAAAWFASGLLGLVLSSGSASFRDLLIRAMVAAGWALILAPVVCRVTQALAARVSISASTQP